TTAGSAVLGSLPPFLSPARISGLASGHVSTVAVRNSGCTFLIAHAVVCDEPQLGAVAPALAVSQPELVQVWQHLGNGELGMARGLGLPDVLGEQVDQHDAAEVNGRGLLFDGNTVEHPLRQLMVLPPTARQVEAFP